MIDKIIEVGMLFDFYGKLLSPRQYMIIESFYILDLSLSEIGEELDISRQSVFDTLKRAEAKLFDFETKLGLVRKFMKNQDSIKNIIELANFINNIISEKTNLEYKTILDKSKLIKELGLRILENS